MANSAMKCFELIITIICIILHYRSFSFVCVASSIENSKDNNNEVLMLITGTFCGYLIILTGLCFSSPPRKLDIFYTLLGAALFLVSGLHIMNYSNSFSNTMLSAYDNENFAEIKGKLALGNAAILLIDSLSLWFREDKTLIANPSGVVYRQMN